MMKTARMIAALAMPLLVWTGPARAAGGDARDLAWPQLVPAEAAAENLKAKSFLGMARPQPPADSSTAPASPFGMPGAPGGPGSESVAQPKADDAPWMSMRSQQPGGDAPAKVVAELDGQRVRIGGYVVALDFDATKITEFLLVPFVGACIHVPPPPPNQIVYVKAAEGFEIGGQFDPVYVTGTIRTARQVTGLAATGYTIEAEKVDLRKE